MAVPVFSLSSSCALSYFRIVSHKLKFRKYRCRIDAIAQRLMRILLGLQQFFGIRRVCGMEGEGDDPHWVLVALSVFGVV